MNPRLKSYIDNGITIPALQDVLRNFLGSEEFHTSPAAKHNHHAYEGGLLEHTLEVTAYALKIARIFRGQVRYNVLLAAALLHDYGKIQEYERLPDGVWGYSLNLGTESHITWGERTFRHACEGRDIPADIVDRIAHCILSHHGPVKEWGSPEAPATIEALILHQADLLSASYGHRKDAP